MITLLQQTQTRRQNRRHTGRRRNAGCTAFKGGQALLERAYRGIGKPRIDIAGLAACETRRRLSRAGEHIAGGRKDRLGMLTFRGTHLAGANRQGVEAVVVKSSSIVASSPRHGINRWAQKTRFRHIRKQVALALAAFIERPQAESSRRYAVTLSS